VSVHVVSTSDPAGARGVPPFTSGGVAEVLEVAVAGPRAGLATVAWLQRSAPGAEPAVFVADVADRAVREVEEVLPAGRAGTGSLALAVAGDGLAVVAVDAGDRLRTRVRPSGATRWTQRLTARQPGVEPSVLRLGANAAGDVRALWMSPRQAPRDAVVVASLRRSATLTATRVRSAARPVRLRVRASADGRLSQVGRARIGGRSVVVCRVRNVAVVAGRSRVARCPLNGAGRRAQAAQRLRVTVASTLDVADGGRATASTVVTLPRG
jgi:hypothetical protein